MCSTCKSWVLQAGLSESANTDSPLQDQSEILNQVKCITWTRTDFITWKPICCLAAIKHEMHTSEMLFHLKSLLSGYKGNTTAFFSL